MNSTIILIGPLGVGKTTVGRLLAEKLALPLCSIDDVRATYYAQAGYDQAIAAKIAADQGIRGVLRYAQPFDAQMVAMVLADYPQRIIDFGASNSVYEDETLLAGVKRILAPYPNVTLLLPSPDLAESVAILQERLTRMLTAAGKTFTDELFALNHYFIQHPSNQQLAKRVIYTKDKTPATVCDEIMQTIV
ncbi:MAG: hypothetical protein R3C14_29160 [Caldilineaceae bacterium]